MAPPQGQGGESQGVMELAIIPLRSQVIFPSIRGTIELSNKVFDELSAFMERTHATGVGTLAMHPSKRGSLEGKGDLYEVGTFCRLIPHSAGETTKGANARQGAAKPGKSSVHVVVEGRSRFRVLEFRQTSPVRVARVQLLEEDVEDESDVGLRALVHSVQEKMTELMRNSQDGAKGLGKRQVNWPSNAALLSSVVGATLMLQLSVEERQQILESKDSRTRLEFVLDLLQRETEAKRMSNEISSNIQKSREMELRQVLIQRQMQEIQKDLKKLRAKTQRESEGPEGQKKNSEEGEEEEEAEDEVARLREKLAKVGLTEDAHRIAKRELRRLKSIQPHHHEYTITHTYLELLAALPWKRKSEDTFNIKQARAVLDEDHRGLEKVKVRILEFLAVQKMRGNMKGPILCLHGPPGIGKTSLGRSVSRALGRKFHRIALGGVRDEAELRGHRRTYIGSIPGVIIQAFQTLGVNNPVILLDEVDKMSQNAMFNPQATLLEILDPEQNDSFKDHYLNTPFDLSRVLFICTANDTSLIDRPLLDRMEVIELSGYTVEEKCSITATHLLPKQRRLHALEAEPQPAPEEQPPSAKAEEEQPASVNTQVEPPAEATLPREPRLVLTPEAVTGLITKWTSESGVRSLERRLAQICRWGALRLQGIRMAGKAGGERDQEREEALASCGPDKNGIITVDMQHLQHIVGVELFEPDLAERLMVGVAMGLSVSTVGGQLLFIEATRTAGHGKLTITGQLGKVMTESVATALSLLRSRLRSGQSAGHVSSKVVNLLRASRAPGDSADEGDDGRRDRDPFKGEDIHVHFPAGGIPKDGPSAGVAVLLALASLVLNRPLRSDTAVTGEVTLRGHVLPVGGIRDKVLAAHRAGISHVLLPLANKRNVLEDIPAKTLKGIEVHYVKHVDEALDWAFGRGAVREEDVAALTSREFPSGVPVAAAAARMTLVGDAFVPPTWARL